MTQHQARKRFGQNFLHDQNVIQKIVLSIKPQKDDHIVEIGPGKGAITELLLENAAKLDVIEIDRDLVPILEERFGDNPVLTIHSTDALRFDFTQLAEEGKKFKLVGNLPYNITTPLLFHLVEQMHVISVMYFMLQKEVVDRIVAKTGSKDYGRLSIMLQYHCEAVKLFEVAPGSFTPRPKVESAIIRLTPRPTPAVHVEDYKLFSQLVNHSFTQRRKTIRNSLRNYLTAEEIEDLGISSSARPETLSIEQFAALANAAHKKT